MTCPPRKSLSPTPANDNRRDPFDVLCDIVAAEFREPVPATRMDWADNLAIDILADAQRHPFREARKLIATRLRFIRRA
jgi:hypothetical protein